MKTCPTCEKELGAALTYPLVEITGFKKAPLPGPIKGTLEADNLLAKSQATRWQRWIVDDGRWSWLPQKVEEQLLNPKQVINGPEEVSYGGYIYSRTGPGVYSKHEDLGAVLRRLLTGGSALSKYLNWLESQKGEIIQKREILTRRPELPRKLRLDIAEDEKNPGNLDIKIMRPSHIGFLTAYYDIDIYTLAELTLEGRLIGQE